LRRLPAPVVRAQELPAHEVVSTVGLHAEIIGTLEIFPNDITFVIRSYLPEEILYAAESVFNASGEYNDVSHPFMTLPPLPARLAAVDVAVDWQDQGWGNLKGTLLFRLQRGDETICSEESFFFLDTHERICMQKLILPRQSKAIERALSGDRLQILRYVGGGGGHSLTVHSFNIRLCFATEYHQRAHISIGGAREQLEARVCLMESGAKF
jgi:hypothetical protein